MTGHDRGPPIETGTEPESETGIGTGTGTGDGIQLADEQGPAPAPAHGRAAVHGEGVGAAEGIAGETVAAAVLMSLPAATPTVLPLFIKGPCLLPPPSLTS